MPSKSRQAVVSKALLTRNEFLLKIFFWMTSVLFVRPLIPLFWTFGDVCPGFQSQDGFLACNGFLRFTSGAAPADLFSASMVAELF